MLVQVINKKQPAGRNTLQNVVNTYGPNGDLWATRVQSYFPSEEDAIAKLKEFGMEPNEDIQIIPYDLHQRHKSNEEIQKET